MGQGLVLYSAKEVKKAEPMMKFLNPWYLLFSLLFAGAHGQTLEARIAAHPRRPVFASGQDPGEAITYRSGPYELQGTIYKPKGPGPFPAVLWNHGSEKNPGPQPELAAFYTSHGFVLFTPIRHGHGGMPGDYIVDLNDRFLAEHKDNEMLAWKLMVPLHEVYNADVAAATDWLKAQSYVDRTRIVITGVSYGGIQTLISAEKIPAICGYVSFAPAAMSWNMTVLRERLLLAIKNAKAPIFLLQAANDYSTEPVKVLGKAIEKKGPPNRAKLYPAFGSPGQHQMGHGSFATWNIGTEIWGPDVLAFINTICQGN
jgi:dienelactone hydrolase